MGGLGSGRSGGSGGRATTEDGLTLSLSNLLRDRSGCAWAGSTTWTSSATGEQVASIGYEAHLRQESGLVRLRHTTTQSDGERHESYYWIQLQTTPQPLGGRRWWFVCPRTGKRAAKLHLPDGAFTFASRQAYRLTYACQREPAHYRALRRAFKLRGKLGAEGGIGDYVPKPKWMRWSTYDRKLEEIFAADDIVDAHTQNFARKLERLGF
jgi:hypothetical protein